MELRPQSAGWVGLGPQGFQGVGAMQRTPFVTGWVARGGGTDVGWGDRGKKKMSNAMSHSALAVWEGDREKGEWMGGGLKGENTFACCMKLDAICHPSWAAS